jgi:hypothetical protein
MKFKGVLFTKGEAQIVCKHRGNLAASGRAFDGVDPAGQAY